MENIINKADIQKDFKVCSERNCDDCLIAGPNDPKLWKSRICIKCHPKARADYYQANKKKINEKIVAKRRLKNASISG